MKRSLIKELKNDLKIIKYIGEEDQSYYCRLIYSAMSEWMRVIILDQTYEENDECKSKNYIRLRCEETLKQFLKLFPECESYFYGDNNKENPINIIRTRLIESGELIETFKGIKLAHRNVESISNKYCKVLGLTKEIFMYSGITRLIEVKGEPSQKQYEFNYNRYFESLKETLKWETLQDTTLLEIFDYRIKKTPSLCWKNTELLMDDVYLGRMKINDYQYDYFWVTKIGENIKISKVNEYFQEFKEYRRFILWQRKKYNNPMKIKCTYSKKYLIVKLYCGIPYKEKKIFNTYGWPLKSINNSYEYLFPRVLENEIKKLFNDLYIEETE